jgi:hypothetical protein
MRWLKNGMLAATKASKINKPIWVEVLMVRCSNNQTASIRTIESAHKAMSAPGKMPSNKTSKPLVDRLRSYLSSNCAMCHIGEAGQNCPTLDARFSNPTAVTDMIERPATTDISVQLMSGARYPSDGPTPLITRPW